MQKIQVLASRQFAQTYCGKHFELRHQIPRISQQGLPENLFMKVFPYKSFGFCVKSVNFVSVVTIYYRSYVAVCMCGALSVPSLWLSPIVWAEREKTVNKTTNKSYLCENRCTKLRSFLFILTVDKNIAEKRRQNSYKYISRQG